MTPRLTKREKTVALRDGSIAAIKLLRARSAISLHDAYEVVHAFRSKSSPATQVVNKQQSRTHKTRIVVDDTELQLEQTGNAVTIKKVVARDRKRKLDITSGVTFALDNSTDPAAIALAKQLKRVAALQTARCTCDYRYGWSDHAEHCESLYVAAYDGGCADDDD